MGNRMIWRAVAAGALVLAATGCARVDTYVLSHDNLDGRNNGSPGAQTARDYIVARLVALGVDAAPATGGPSYFQDFEFDAGASVGTNVLGVVPGTDLAHEYVVVGAHYDHLGGCAEGEPPGDVICNGATDNATGVAAVLDIAAHIRAHPVSRSVVFAFWDAEEDGLVGSQHYVANPVVPLADTVAYVNYDIAGANLRPSLRDTTFVLGAETGGPVLTDIAAAATAVGPADAVMLSAVFGQYRSDYASFIQAGVPTVFYSDSTGPCYHTADDELSVVDFAKLDLEMAMGRHVTTALADSPVRPTFAAGAPLVVFDDVVALEAATAAALADPGPMTPAEIAALEAAHDVLVGVVDAGEGAFATDDWAPVFNAVLTLVGLLTSGPCDSFITP